MGLVEAYRVRDALNLVGMSLGGLLAQLVALKYAERVLTLTAIASERLGPEDPEMPPMDPRIPAYHGRSASLDWSNRGAVIEYSVEGWRLLAGTRHPFDETGIRTMAGQDFDRAHNLQTIMNHALLSGGECWHNRLAEVRAPALVIHGTEDPVLPYAHGVALAEALPHSKLITLRGAGHELHPTDWEIIIDAIIRHTVG